jgi:hypothetical protein
MQSIFNVLVLNDLNLFHPVVSGCLLRCHCYFRFDIQTAQYESLLSGTLGKELHDQTKLPSLGNLSTLIEHHTTISFSIVI